MCNKRNAVPTFRREGSDFVKSKKWLGEIYESHLRVAEGELCSIKNYRVDKANNRHELSSDLLTRGECIEMASVLFFLTDQVVSDGRRKLSLITSVDQENMTNEELVQHYSDSWGRHLRLQSRSSIYTIFRVFLERCDDELTILSILKYLLRWSERENDSYFQTRLSQAIGQSYA